MDICLPKIDTLTGAEAGSKMTVILPNGQPYLQADGKTPLTITLRGADSKAYRDAAREVTRKRVDRGSNQGSFESRVEEAEADAIGLLVAATVAWDGVVDSKSKPVPVTPEAATALYSSFPAIRDQAELFVGSRVNFTPRS